MGNISALSSISTAALSLANIILVSPQNTVGYQPQNAPVINGVPQQQPPAIIFNYEGEQTSILQSDITDHFVEDNTAINDQIALRPEEITTSGFIGELNDISPAAFLGLQQVADKLTTISGYAPQLSVTALNAYNEAVFAYNTAAAVVNSAVSSWSSIIGAQGETVIGSTGITSQALIQNKQQTAYNQFYGYWRNRTLFTVQTPWAVFQNMAIKSLKAVQSAETNVITDFEITFKIIRFASTSVTGGIQNIGNYQNRAANQFAGGQTPVNLGFNSPVTATQSLASKITSIA